MIIDTHCHLYLPEFDADRADMLLRARERGVERFLLPAIDRETHARLLAMEAENEGFCMAMMGLHPCSVKQDFREELSLVRKFLDSRRFVAVGEMGLDLYWDRSFEKEQVEAFRQQAEWALEFDLPLVIHSREAVNECIALVKEFEGRGLKGVFHCFSGTPEQARQIIELGFYLGIGGVVTFKNGGLDKVIPLTGLDKLVLETDSPYLAPVPFRGKRNESSYLPFVVNKLSELSGKENREVERITTANAEALFQFHRFS